MVRKKQHNDGLVDGNIHSKKRPSTTKFQYPTFPADWNAEWKLVAAYREDAGIGELSRELIGVLRESMGGVE